MALAKYRNCLPMVTNPEGLFLTEVGLETILIFERGINLPEFAAFTLLKTDEGRKILHDITSASWKVAREHKVSGFIAETPTWRASSAWAAKLGISDEELVILIKTGVSDLLQFREKSVTQDDYIPFVIAGAVGPKGDGFVVNESLTPEESKNYHELEIAAMAEAGVDLVVAATMTHVGEALGIILAAKESNVPVIIGFTVETDGKLPDGTTLKEAIVKTDEMSSSYAVYFMVNCAHPSHFSPLFKSPPREDWMKRIRAIRANPSGKSHAELDESPTLDAGDPVEFGRLCGQMKKCLPELNVFGGCCGTNEKHLDQVAVTLKTLYDF